jgi:hypothetical protein
MLPGSLARLIRALLCGLLYSLAPCAVRAQPSGDAPATLPGAAGRWAGVLVNFPARTGAPRVEVHMELGALPATDSTCVPWHTTYREQGEVRGVKAYRLCRGAGAQSLYIDEGGGVHLAARVIGDVLVSAFKVGPLLLVTHLRVEGDVLTEEIITVDDRAGSDGLVTLPVRGIQRLVLKRQH